MMVFDDINAEKATFDISKSQTIKPVEILNNKFILQDELENIIMQHDNSIIFEKRDVLESELKQITI